MTAYQIFIEAKAKRDAESQQRLAIKMTNEYIDIDRRISQLQDLQAAMLAEVPDSSEEYEKAKADMIAFLTSSSLSHFQNVAAKYREKKEVNKKRVLDALEGDLDRFYELAHITQVRLKEAAKDDPILKNDLLDCIEVVEKEIVDLEVVLPAS